MRKIKKQIYKIISTIPPTPILCNNKRLPIVLANMFNFHPKSIQILCPSGFRFHFECDNDNYLMYEQLYLGFISSVLTEKERDLYKKQLRGEY